VPVVLTAHDLKLACPSYKMLSAGSVCEACKGGRIWNVAVKRCLKGSRALSGLIAVETAVHRWLDLYGANVDRLVAPSQFYRDKLVEWGWPAEKLVYIPNFSPALWPESPVPEEGPLLYFGRLSEEKGVATLVRAAALSGVRVVVAGTGPQGAELQALARQLRAPVEFVGHQSGGALGMLIARARAIVLPSEWYENAPMSVLEAYSAGRPVLGAAIGGIPEMIEPGITGWIFPSGDEAALAARMGEIAAAPAAAADGHGPRGQPLCPRPFQRGALSGSDARALCLAGGFAGASRAVA
jgi:glycosyltransferase involved in cell wall biosynthesis